MRGQCSSSTEMEGEVIMQSGHMYKWNDVEQTDKVTCEVLPTCQQARVTNNHGL